MTKVKRIQKPKCQIVLIHFVAKNSLHARHRFLLKGSPTVPTTDYFPAERQCFQDSTLTTVPGESVSALAEVLCCSHKPATSIMQSFFGYACFEWWLHKW